MPRSLKKKIFYATLIVVLLIVFLHPEMNARQSYDFIKKDDIFYYLHKEIVKNLTSRTSVDCQYHDTISDDATWSPSLMDGDLIDGHKILEGGEYAPTKCKPKFSTAIIVPYRDRADELRGFLVYMHMFLRRQRIHYRIYVVEQVDSKPFNRAKLLNVGAKVAMRAGYPCLVLHDVDLLPLRPANLYACTVKPRHMATSINTFRFVLPYLEFIGGALAILSKQFKAINGMSNEYYGLGYENKDLYTRLEAHNVTPCRFEPETGMYHMIYHQMQPRGELPKKLPGSTMKTDGLNSLHYMEVVTVMHPLFTHIVVDL